MRKSGYLAMLDDLWEQYFYEPEDSLCPWWWETFYRGRHHPWSWSSEIASATEYEESTR